MESETKVESTENVPKNDEEQPKSQTSSKTSVPNPEFLEVAPTDAVSTNEIQEKQTGAEEKVKSSSKISVVSGSKNQQDQSIEKPLSDEEKKQESSKTSKTSKTSLASTSKEQTQSTTVVKETKVENLAELSPGTDAEKKPSDLGAHELDELFNIQSVVSEKTLIAAGVEKPKVPIPLTQEEKDALELEKHINKADKKIEELPMDDKQVAIKVAEAAAEIQGEIYEIPDEKKSTSTVLFGSSSSLDEAAEVEEKDLTEEEKQEKQIEEMKELVKSFLPLSKFKRKTFDGEGEFSDEGEMPKKKVDETLSSSGLTPEEIDRDPYYDQYYKLAPIFATTQLRNMILLRKLTTYYKKKKMEHVLKTSEEDFDTIQKYRNRLDALSELLDINKNQRIAFNEELKDLRKNRNEKKHRVEVLCKSLLDREKSIGYGLISSKTGSPLPDKYVESLIKRQKVQINLMRQLRLKYILLKNKIAQKQKRLKELDTIGEGYPLIDYEELKMEHRSYMDKIEERDDELCKLRSKVKDAIQTLAHVKEKSAAINSTLVQLQLRSNRINMSNNIIRENLNELKQKREYYRKMTNKAHMECGLLTYPELLRDMESAIQEQKIKAEELNKLKIDNETKAQKIRAIRKNIEQSVGEKAKKLEKAKSKKKRRSIEAPARRPTIFQPQLSENMVKTFQKLNPSISSQSSNHDDNHNDNHNDNNSNNS